MRLLMATVNGADAEPVTIEVEDGVVTLTLDDGTPLEFDWREFAAVVLDELHAEGEAKWREAS